MDNEPTPFSAKDSGAFYHGTKADLKPGDVLEHGNRSNFGERKIANYIYLTATLAGNVTRSYRTKDGLRIVGELLDWEGHSAEALQAMRDHIDEAKRLGIEAINE